MSTDIETRLSAPPDRLLRLVQGVLDWAPRAAPLPAWTTWAEGAASLGLPPEAAAAAPRRATEAAPAKALAVLDALDEGEDLFSIASGLGTSLRLAFARSRDGLAGGLDDVAIRQRADAADKVLALADALAALFPGEAAGRLDRLQRLPAGRALVSWIVIVELALPFMDEVAGGRIGAFLEAEHAGAVQRLGAVLGAEEAAAANLGWAGVVAVLVPQAEAMIRTPFDVGGVVSRYLPKAVAMGDSVAGVAAGAFDALPVYRLLAARVVAEAALLGTWDEPAVAEVAPKLAPEAAPGLAHVAAVGAEEVLATATTVEAAGTVEPAGTVEAAGTVEGPPDAPTPETPPEPEWAGPTPEPPAALAPPALPAPSGVLAPPAALAPPAPPPVLAPPAPPRPVQAAPSAPARPPPARAGSGLLGLGLGVTVVLVLLCGGAGAVGVGWWWTQNAPAPASTTAAPAATPTTTTPTTTPAPEKVDKTRSGRPRGRR